MKQKGGKDKPQAYTTVEFVATVQPRQYLMEYQSS